MKAVHMNTKCKVAELLNCYVRGVEKQAESSGIKTFLDSGKKYLKWSKELETDDILICLTVSYNPEENGQAGRTKCIMKNAIWTLLIHPLL